MGLVRCCSDGGRAPGVKALADEGVRGCEEEEDWRRKEVDWRWGEEEELS